MSYMERRRIKRPLKLLSDYFPIPIRKCFDKNPKFNFFFKEKYSIL